MLPQAAADHYRQQQRLTVATLAATRHVWAQMGTDFNGSWTRVRPRLAMIVTAGQLVAARSSSDYMAAVLAETGQTDEPVATLRPAALAGIASDGRTLDGLLDGAVVNAKQGTETLPPDEALDRGGRWLDMAVQTTLADTSRSATAVALAIRPAIAGYTRMISLPVCNRCAALAGHFYRWNQGFRRHPRCDCRHVPTSREQSSQFITHSTTDSNVDLSGTSTTATSRRPVPEYLMQTAPSRAAAIDSLRRYGYAA